MIKDGLVTGKGEEAARFSEEDAELLSSLSISVTRALSLKKEIKKGSCLRFAVF